MWLKFEREFGRHLVHLATYSRLAVPLTPTLNHHEVWGYVMGTLFAVAVLLSGAHHGLPGLQLAEGELVGSRTENGTCIETRSNLSAKG